MRVVRFSSQQRVDNPDATAMSFLPLGEFRRLARAVILGPSLAGSPDSDVSLIRGFAVEPQTVPDTTVIIRLDPGGGQPLSAAWLAENLGSRNEGGQLAGGNDSAGRTEGNATATLDFSGEVAGSYLVEMRFVYTKGVRDTRAFWREADDEEFVAQTDTRFLPSLEYRIASTASTDEWASLASVSWSGPGGTISAAEITDFRTFTFEGVAAFAQTSDGDQDSFSSWPDFNRDVDRGTNGFNEIYPALRALARQIRDLKGPMWNGTRFAWDWFSRPLAPKDYADAGLPYGDSHTKTLGTVETVTYTVGDGINTHGDFNGADGLQKALEALDGTANPLGRPRRVRIVLKADTRFPVTQLVQTPFDFSVDGDLHITLEAVSANGAYGDQGLAEIEFTALGSDFQWLTCRGVTLSNVSLYVTTARQGLLDVSEAVIRNSRLETTPDITTYADLSGGNHALRCDQSSEGYNLLIERSELKGPIRITDNPSNFLTALNRKRQGRIVGCEFGANAPLLLNDLHQASSTGKRSSVGLLVEGCAFADTVALQTNAFGMVDGRTAQNITFRDCQFSAVTRHQDIIHLGAGGGDLPEANWLIENCLFRTGSIRSVAVDAGPNGADGTGWSIYHTSDSVVAGAAEESSIRVEGCVFEGQGAVAIQDSGALFFHDTAQIVVRDCQFFNWGANDNNRVRVVSLTGTTVGKGNASIQDNRFFDFAAPTVGGGEVSGIYVNGFHHCLLQNNRLRGLTSADGAVLMATDLSAAIRVVAALDFFIEKNRIEGWSGAQAGIQLGDSVAGGICARFHVKNNTLYQVSQQVAGRYAISAAEGGSAVVRDGNICGNIIVTAVNGNGIDVTDSENMVVNDNNIQMDASGTSEGITWGSGPDECMCSGNRVHGGLVSASGAGVVYGVQNSTRNDLNFAN